MGKLQMEGQILVSKVMTAEQCEPFARALLGVEAKFDPAKLYRISIEGAVKDQPAAQHQGLVTGDLARVYDVIGLHHSHPVGVLLENFKNIKRFSDYLDAVEREFFMVPGEPSEEPEDEGCEPDDECLVSKWSAESTEHYVERFRAALARIGTQHQGEPVALPERKGMHLRYDTLMPTFSKGWNACLTEVEKLGPLYARAGRGEVEQLSLIISNLNEERDELGVEVGRLRAKLAGRDALLRDFCAHSALICGDLLRLAREDDCATTDPIRARAYSAMDLSRKVKKALSASAEPSEREAQALQAEKLLGIERLPVEQMAPVERDERAEFEMVYSLHHLARDVLSGAYVNAETRSLWDGWQARAALERKP